MLNEKLRAAAKISGNGRQSDADLVDGTLLVS
jgi:hypothetical protein